jgi:excisionase family DNA binding protein
MSATVSAVQIDKLTLSLVEIEMLTGLSRATLYRLMGDGKLESVKVRGRRLIPGSELKRLLLEGSSSRATRLLNVNRAAGHAQ